MMKTLFIVVTILALGGVSCHSSEPQKQPSSDTKMSPPNVKQPTAITQNASIVEAVIENIEMIDDVHYHLTIFVTSSTPVEGRVSIFEPGQRVTVSPKFITDEAGTVDPNNERNVVLLALRTTNIGVSFKGTIVLDQRGGWNLVDVVKK